MASRTAATHKGHSHLAAGARPTTARSPLSRRPILIVAAAAGIAIVAAVAAMLGSVRTSARHDGATSLPATSMATALTVDGQAIPLRELMLQVEADRAATFGYFQQNFHAGDTAGFWHTRFGTTTPAGYLTEHAVADTVSIAVERQLAQKRGLLADPGYPAFLQSWTAENARRATALAKHQVIYGPTQYSEAGYFTYVMSDLGPRLEQALTADGSIAVSDADVKAYYLAHPEKFPAAAVQGPGSTAPFQTVEAQARQLLLDDRFRAYLASAAAHATVVKANDILARIPLG